MTFKHSIEIDGKIYTRKSEREYVFALVVKEANHDMILVGSYVTDYGNEYCGVEVIQPNGYKSLCGTYSPQLDNPQKDEAIRKKVAEQYPNRECVMVKHVITNFHKDIFCCPKHSNQEYTYATFDYYAKKIQPESNPNKREVISWHGTYKNAISAQKQVQKYMYYNKQIKFESVEIVPIPKENIIPVQHRKKD